MNLKNAIIDGVKTMKDGSLKITLVTQELTPNQMAEIFLWINNAVSVELPTDGWDGKSPSTRLRNILYRYWEQNKKWEYKEFEIFYPVIMRQIWEAYKDKLN